MRGMLLQVLIERHRLFNHLLMQLRGIQQVKPVVLPHSKTQMGDVEPWFVASDGDDITVMDGLAQQFAIADSRLGNIAK